MRKKRLIFGLLSFLLCLSGCASRERLTVITPVSSIPSIEWQEESAESTLSSKASGTVSGAASSNYREKLAEKKKEYELLRLTFELYEEDYKSVAARIKSEIDDTESALLKVKEQLQSDQAYLHFLNVENNGQSAVEVQQIKDKAEQEEKDVAQLEVQLEKLKAEKVLLDREYTDAKLRYEQKSFEQQAEITLLSGK